VNTVAGVAIGTAVGLLLVLAGPAVVRKVDPCVATGALTLADSVFRDDSGACVGWTFGSVVFDERLKSVQDLIKTQNDTVVASGEEYVTVAYVGELSVADPVGDRNRLAGVHGELVGLAHRQRSHNGDHEQGDYPPIRLMLVNIGPGWSAAEEVAEKVAGYAADDETLLAAVGFGTSVEGNTTVIRRLTEAGIPMVGSTVTYDDVALMGGDRYSDLFFPIAPSNSRIARQAAYWARHGAGHGDEEGGPALEPSATAVAIADGSEGETYGVHLAENFMEAFTGLGGVDPVGRVLSYDSADGQSLQDTIREACEHSPELVYFAGRSDDFGRFYRSLPTEGECADGVRVLGGDDIAKYVTDYLPVLRSNYENHPVYYTPLAASGAWGRSGDRGENGIYARLEELSDGLAQEEPEPDVGEDELGDDPSIAHAVMGNDALIVVAKAINDAAEEQRHPTNLETEIRSPTTLVGGSGHIRFAADNGHWYDDKLIQLVSAGHGAEQEVVDACGQVTAKESSESDDSPCA
jgi:ABC-type branched-subunit amino acid transport system substrate-binding protein